MAVCSMHALIVKKMDTDQNNLPSFKFNKKKSRKTTENMRIKDRVS